MVRKRPEDVIPSVAYDAVDESSVESMVTSDPPARGVTRIGEPKRPCDPVPASPSKGERDAEPESPVPPAD
jgi:hypothetical protein